MSINQFVVSFFIICPPSGSPSRGGDVVVNVKDINQPSLLTPFLFCSCVYFCLYGPFNCISFHKFSRELSGFYLCSSSPNSAIAVLSTIYFFTKVSLSPDIILCGWLGLKHQLSLSLSRFFFLWRHFLQPR